MLRTALPQHVNAITAGRVDISFPSAHATLEEWAMLIDSKRVRPGERDGVGRHETRAVRRGIGAALRTLYSDVLREETPDRIAELLSQLDQKDRDST
jgi:Anti-sigma factor NepR